MENINSQIDSLNTYINNNFKQFNISIYCEKVSLCNIDKFNIFINNRNYVCDNEVLAWTFIDGLYCALNSMQKN
jgi:archaellum component FlaF (FlaF/FlaG flagellin family)